MKRFLVCSGVTFALALAFLLWLGPVWIYDVEDRILAFFGAIFIYVFILRNGVWTDPWDRPFFYEARKGLMSWTVRAYSFGANGHDDGGKPDDLSIAETLGLWKKLIRRLDAALKEDPK